jgi:hypothetical protein
VPFPSVSATQTDAAGTMQTFFASASGGDGGYVIVGLAMGDFLVTAQDPNSGLQGTSSGSLSELTMPAIVNVTLQQAGTVNGTVFDANDNVVPLAFVSLSSSGLADFTRTARAGAQGRYQIERVALGSVFLQACDFVTTGLCGSAAGTLAAEGEVATIDIRLPATGTVQGTVFGSDGSTPVPNAAVVFQSFSSGGPFGFVQRSVTADASGNYQLAGVPAGPARVTANDPADFYAVGIADGTVAPAEVTVIDVTLGSAVRFPFDLDGEDGFRYDVGCTGELGEGGTSDGRLDPAYEGAYELHVNGRSLGCAAAGLLEDDGREVVVGPFGLGSLNVTRKVFVPATGGFARYLELLSNPTSVPVTVAVQVNSELDSGSRTRVVVSPAATGDTFAVTDQGGFCCDPALAHVFGGPGALAVSATQFEDGEDDIFYRWEVTVPPGETVILMHFAVQREVSDTAGAQAEAEALVALSDVDALAGMSTEERDQVANFVLP